MRLLNKVASRLHRTPQTPEQIAEAALARKAERSTDRFFRAPRLLPKFKVADRAISQPHLVNLITRLGAPPHTAWLDPKYRMFTTPAVDGAVGYVKRMGCAVVFGEPLSDPAQQGLLTEAFEKYCRKRGLSPLYCATRKDFAQATANRGGGYIEFGAEDILIPAQNKTSGNLRQQIKKAHNAGVRVAEYERPSSGGDVALETRCDSLVDAWLASRAGMQMFGCRVQPFAAGSQGRWLYATRDDKVIGFITLTALNAQKGYSIEHCIVEPEAPAGTSEWLIDASIGVLREQGVAYESFGIAAGPKLGEIVGLSPRAVDIAQALYSKVDNFMHFSGKINFHKKFGVKRREPLFVAFPKPLGLRQMTAVVLAMNSEDAK